MTQDCAISLEELASLLRDMPEEKLVVGDGAALCGDYLSTALYTLLRHYYRRGGGNEDFFAVDSVDFDAGTVDAAMLRSRAVYLRALAEAEQVPELNSDALTAAPGVGQSTAQVVHNVDDLAAKR